MSRLDAQFALKLGELDRAGRRRALAPLGRDGAGLLNFSANDYLGLARHPALAERAAAWGREFGTGAGASRLVTGTLALHTQLEAKVAAFKGREAALVLASGWQANVSVVAALLRFGGPDAKLYFDELNHSSLQYGARAGGIKPIRFRHNDLAHLEALLAAEAGAPGRRFIVTESVFSMDGDRANLAALQDLADRYDAFLYVDEAHATGVLGARGAGLCLGAAGIDLVMGTFSKALGGFGAYVAGSQVLIDWLVNECAGFIFTTALSPPMLGAIDAALDIVPGMDRERARLAANAGRVREAFVELGIDTAGSSTQIIPAIVGDARAALALAADMRAQGILAVAIRPPTVPAGTSRLRFALSAAHDEAAIEAMLAAMRQAWPRLRLAA